jgi:O-antigen ligase
MHEWSELLISKTKQNKLVAFTIFGYATLALAHIPLGIFTTVFDKNQAPEFIVGLFLAGALGLVTVIKRDRLPVSNLPLILTGFLLTSLLISAFMSPSISASITGDTLRYAGIASTIALILVSVFHGLFDPNSFPKVLFGYLFVLTLTEILAVLQFFKLIILPGVQGNPTSTFGNLDFYAAYVGTSIPLVIFGFIRGGRNLKKFIAGLFVLSVICLRMADAKQGYFDLAIALIAVVSGVLYRRFKRDSVQNAYSVNVKTFIATFALFIWLEIIFMVPFLGNSIPTVSKDPQVAIRGVMWLAGINQFKSSPIFGVGPDQYGSFYEHFRTVNSTIVLPGDSSNDAHSATVQTLATTGIVGSILFFLLISLVIRSIFLILEKGSIARREIAALALYIFIYLTNAAISPIVLPNKYLFWAICGFLLFEGIRGQEKTEFSKILRKVTIGAIATLTAFVLFVGANFIIAQYNFVSWSETIRDNKSAQLDVRVSAFMPCHIYFAMLSEYIAPRGNEALEKLTRDQVALNPRCQEAQRMLAVLAYNRGDYNEMGKRVHILIDLAPVQRDVLDIANLYAIKFGDKKLEATITAQLARMGVHEIQIG